MVHNCHHSVTEEHDEGWIKRAVVAQLLPFEKDFNKLTWRSTYYDGQIPPVNTETRREANFSKRNPGYVPWWTHNGYRSMTMIGI
jgi:hypothetical protein